MISDILQKESWDFTMSSISVQDFAGKLQDPATVIIDTRDQSAYEEGHLDHAISMPVTSLPNRLHEFSKDKTYYILSHSGRRSEILAQFLQDNGFQSVHVIGGMKAYRSAFVTAA